MSKHSPDCDLMEAASFGTMGNFCTCGKDATPGPWGTIKQAPVQGIDGIEKLGLRSVCVKSGNTIHILAEMALPADACLMSKAPEMSAEIDRLRSEKAELVAALKNFNAWGDNSFFCSCPMQDAYAADEFHSTVCQEARAALAKADRA